MHERQRRKLSKEAQLAKEKAIKKLKTLKIIGAAAVISAVTAVGGYEAYNSQGGSANNRIVLSNGMSLEPTAPITKKGTFTTSSGTTYDYINATPYKFNVDAAKGMFSYYNSIFPNSGIAIPIKHGNVAERADIYPTNPAVRRQLLFLQPKDAEPLIDALASLSVSSHPLAETVGDQSGPRLTYISFANDPSSKGLMPMNVQVSANLSMAIEGCNETINATGSADANTKIHYAKEIICGSLGVTYAAAQRGESFTQYYSDFSHIVLGGVDAPLVLFNNKQYAAIPRLQPIFTATKAK